MAKEVGLQETYFLGIHISLLPDGPIEYADMPDSLTPKQHTKAVGKENSVRYQVLQRSTTA